MWAMGLLWLQRYFVWFSLSKSGAHLMGKPGSGRTFLLLSSWFVLCSLSASWESAIFVVLC